MYNSISIRLDSLNLPLTITKTTIDISSKLSLWRLICTITPCAIPIGHFLNCLPEESRTRPRMHIKISCIYTAAATNPKIAEQTRSIHKYTRAPPDRHFPFPTWDTPANHAFINCGGPLIADRGAPLWHQMQAFNISRAVAVGPAPRGRGAEIRHGGHQRNLPPSLPGTEATGPRRKPGKVPTSRWGAVFNSAGRCRIRSR